MSHGYACEFGISSLSRVSRSRFRASIATEYPPREKRRAIAAPVPGPTPVTSATGFFFSIGRAPLSLRRFANLIVHDFCVFETRDIVRAISELAQDSGVVRAQLWRHRADFSWRAIE